ncbi:MAG: TraR/DksA family transcriptional regulator [Planctomycetales bacterium]|nr:TraR/DksA family transcriptional regulator [Planctomycetales bacterium]
MGKSRKQVIAALKQTLIERRNTIRRALAGDINALRELREMSGDAADFASESSSTELNSQLAEVESRELQQIDNALAQMEAGTYGICEITGKEIPIARLEALPYVTTTIEAQRMIEENGGRANFTPDWSRMIDSPGDDTNISINDIEYL